MIDRDSLVWYNGCIKETIAKCFKFGFVGMFRLAQTPVGSDALVAPPHKTFQYVSGVKVKNTYLTIDKGIFQVAERRGRRSLQ